MRAALLLLALAAIPAAAQEPPSPSPALALSVDEAVMLVAMMPGRKLSMMISMSGIMRLTILTPSGSFRAISMDFFPRLSQGLKIV